ncbi:hypothetical protein [Paenibacillus paeoniae]|nr:hypothetical protein [Paenibacillus paeoniae]
MTKVIPVSEIPQWQREAVLMDWVRWVVIRDGKIDSGHKTLGQANRASQ